MLETEESVRLGRMTFHRPDQFVKGLFSTFRNASGSEWCSIFPSGSLTCTVGLNTASPLSFPFLEASLNPVLPRQLDGLAL